MLLRLILNRFYLGDFLQVCHHRIESNTAIIKALTTGDDGRQDTLRIRGSTAQKSLDPAVLPEFSAKH
jgi:hypothetical protein